MKTYLAIVSALCLVLVPMMQGQQSPAPAPPPLMPMVTMSGLLRLIQTVPLPTDVACSACPSSMWMMT